MEDIMPLPSSPLNQSEGIFNVLHPDGRIEIVMVKEGSSVASIICRPEKLTGIVYTLLFTAAAVLWCRTRFSRRVNPESGLRASRFQ